MGVNIHIFMCYIKGYFEIDLCEHEDVIIHPLIFELAMVLSVFK